MKHFEKQSCNNISYNLYNESEASEPRMSEVAGSILDACKEADTPPELFNLTFVSNLVMALVSAFAGVFQQIGSRLAHFGLVASKNHQPVVCSDTM